MATDKLYAIVDIETTGGYAAASGITEICIQVLDGENVVQRFDSLINPLHTIPPYIQAMTGITNAMVANAPLFETVAEQVFNILNGKVFVAHSVNFDYSFIKSQLAVCGYDLNAPKLCTVRLSRKLIPNMPSYSLGKLCSSLGIQHINHHRAGGDTDATVRLFKLLLQRDRNNHIKASLARNSKECILPPHVPKTDFDQLPYTPGVYYFHDQKGKVVYVGKAKNIRYRVNSHFSNNATSRQKQNFMRHVYNISFEECGTELTAAIKEASEIKKLWPRFNAAQKKREDLYAVISYTDINGYMRLAIDKTSGKVAPLATFHNIHQAKAFIRQLVHDFSLCARLCFIDEKVYDENLHTVLCKGACKKEESAIVYNSRVMNALEYMQKQPTFAIIDEGITREQQSCILVMNGRFYGMGYIDKDNQLTSIELLKEFVQPYKENSVITNMIFAYAKRYPQKVVTFM